MNRLPSPPQPDATPLVADLQTALALYQDILRTVEVEHQLLRQSEPQSLQAQFTARQEMLPRLGQSARLLRQHRETWARLSPTQRSAFPGAGPLMRQCQQAILRILLLDRENEQALLRRGLLAPRELPAHQRQRPHFVADLYRRQGLSAG